MFIRRVHIRADERGLFYRHGELQRLLAPGRFWLPTWPLAAEVERISVRQSRIEHEDLEVLIKRDLLREEALVVEVADNQRALVWLDGRFAGILGPGRYAYWTSFVQVRAELVDARVPIFEHPELLTVLASPTATTQLEKVEVEAEHVGLLFVDGRLHRVLDAGLHAVWRGRSRTRLVKVDRREQVLDLQGQDVLTQEMVSVRLNLVVTFRVADPVVAVTTVDDYRQALYREAQLAARMVFGSRSVDALLVERDAMHRELESTLRQRAASFGVQLVSAGLRDLILPGELRTLLNQVTEARKAAEANLVTRREEVAAMRSQANTAKIFEQNPTLMRLRELEVLEKVADKANLNVVLSESGLADRVLKLV